MSYLGELQTKPQMSSSEARQWHETKQRDRQGLDDEALRHEPLHAEIRALKHQARKNEETIEKMKRQSEIQELEAIGTILALRKEHTELSGYNTHLSWEAARLAARVREVESYNRDLVPQDLVLEIVR